MIMKQSLQRHVQYELNTHNINYNQIHSGIEVVR